MFATTQDPEFVQGQSRDVPDRELGPNIHTQVFNLYGIYVPGRFETLAVSKRPLAVSKLPNYLLGRFETFLGFEMAWPVQNLVSKWPNQ